MLIAERFTKLCAITIRAHNTACVLNAQHFLIRMPLKHTIQIWLRQSIKCIYFNQPLSFGHAITAGEGYQYIICVHPFFQLFANPFTNK